ncbi:MAG: hypothetical protein H0V87_12115 [Chloroflexi bacterium]|nr:hypothetical protein [Chloroflexota bacterium]
MSFVGRVLRDAFRLLSIAPPDLLLVVVAMLLVGAVLANDPGLGLLGVTWDFAGVTLLVGGLVGRPAPDRLPAAASRVARRIVAVIGQTLVLIAIFLGVAAVAGVISIPVVAVAGPSVGLSIEDLATFDLLDPPPAQRTLGLVLLSIMGLLFALVFGRLLPAQAIVLEREVGAVASIRQSWALTRGRTLACAALMFLVTVAGSVIVALLPSGPGAILGVLPAVFGVAVGVAVDRQLRPGPGTSAAGPSA